MEQRILKYTISCFLALSVLSPGCRERMENKRLMEQAALLAEQNPDSAVILLDAVNPVTFGSKQQAEYDLLRVQAKDNAGRDIAVDTEIFRARDYFIEKKDNEKAALACFYAGRMLQSQEKEKEAVENYLRAEDFARPIPDDRLNGRIQTGIGDANYMLGLLDKALPRFMRAVEYYRALGNEKAEMGIRIKIGNCYLINDEPDSAFANYRKAEKLAEYNKDTAMLIAVMQNTGVACMHTGNYDRAIEMYRKALSLTDRRTDSVQLLMSMAQIRFKSDQLDSARIYGEKALAAIDSGVAKHILVNVYHQLLLIEAKQRNGDPIIDYFTKYNAVLNEVLEKENNESLLEIQEKYDYEKVKDNYAIEKRNNIIAGLCLLILLSGFFLYVVVAYKRKVRVISEMRMKLDALAAMKEEAAAESVSEKTLEEELSKAEILRKELNEARLNIEKLKREASSRQLILDEIAKLDNIAERLKKTEKNNELLFRGFLMNYFNVLKKMEQLKEEIIEKKNESEIKLMKKVTIILYGKSGARYRDAIYKAMPKTLVDKLENNFETLDNTEIMICCLSYFNINNAYMAAILDIASTSLSTDKYRIRKKLGINPGGDIGAFLKDRIG